MAFWNELFNSTVQFLAMIVLVTGSCILGAFLSKKKKNKKDK